MSATTSAKPRRKTLAKFDAECPRCDGSGLWNNRPGYTCHDCDGAGQITVAAVRSPGMGVRFHTVTPKGTVRKQADYELPARTTKPWPSFAGGMTLGGGSWHELRSVSPVGTEVAVIGILRDGELHIRRGGGYTPTGQHEGRVGSERTGWGEPVKYEVAVELIDPEHAALVESLREAIAA